MGKNRTSPDAIYERIADEFERDFYVTSAMLQPRNIAVLDALASIHSRSGEFEQALSCNRRLLELRPRDPRFLYNLACSLCCLGRASEGLQALEQAIEAGFQNYEFLAKDPDLAALHSRPEFDLYRRRALAQKTRRLMRESARNKD